MLTCCLIYRKVYYDRYNSEKENILGYVWRQWGKIFCRSVSPSYASIAELADVYVASTVRNEENEGLLESAEPT